MPAIRTSLFSFMLLVVSAPLAAATFEEGLAAYDAATASKDLEHEGYAQAYEIWRPLAKAGHPGATYHVGMLHYFGLGGVEFDQYRAFQLFTAAAENGYPLAQSLLGLMAEQGDGTFTVVSEDVALQWYRKSAESGHCPAVRRLSVAYEKGELGLTPDAEQAAEWRSRIAGCRRR